MVPRCSKVSLGLETLRKLVKHDQRFLLMPLAPRGPGESGGDVHICSVWTGTDLDSLYFSLGSSSFRLNKYIIPPGKSVRQHRVLTILAFPSIRQVDSAVYWLERSQESFPSDTLKGLSQVHVHLRVV